MECLGQQGSQCKQALLMGKFNIHYVIIMCSQLLLEGNIFIESLHVNGFQSSFFIITINSRCQQIPCI